VQGQHQAVVRPAQHLAQLIEGLAGGGQGNRIRAVVDEAGHCLEIVQRLADAGESQSLDGATSLTHLFDLLPQLFKVQVAAQPFFPRSTERTAEGATGLGRQAESTARVPDRLNAQPVGKLDGKAPIHHCQPCPIHRPHAWHHSRAPSG